jgi:hypothetical protein
VLLAYGLSPVPTADRFGMEPPAPLQNTPHAMDDSIALTACVRAHTELKRGQDGVAFVIAGGRNEHIDARRLLHAVSSPDSMLEVHSVEGWDKVCTTTHTCTLACALASIPEELVSYMATYMRACDLFNLARACKQLASTFSVSLVSEGNEPLRRHVERAARLPRGLTACGLMREMDSALCILGYFCHSNVHKFKHGSERQSCLNALASVHASGGVQRRISVLPSNVVSGSGFGPIYQRRYDSPSGTFVLYFPSDGYHIYLLEKQSHMEHPKYSVVAREEVGPELDVGIQWTPDGPKAIVYHMRTKRTVVVSVVELAKTALTSADGALRKVAGVNTW